MRSSPETVLVVEDEPLLRLLAADLLEDAGYTTLSASCAAEAVAILESRGSVDAVFSDIEMPGAMNGLSLAQHIRQHWPSVAVLLVSGRLAPMLTQDRRTGFLHKPYSQSEVVEALHRLAA